MSFERIDKDGVIHLRVGGALDVASAPKLREELEQIAEDKPKKVVCDVSELRLIDSAGVGAFVSMYKKMQTWGGSITLIGLRDQPLAIFKVLRLERVFGL
jgi:anti-sigma B factor antagonist